VDDGACTVDAAVYFDTSIQSNGWLDLHRIMRQGGLDLGLGVGHLRKHDYCGNHGGGMDLIGVRRQR
jgi:hypothetical protein